jgi:hypothetical protein
MRAAVFWLPCRRQNVSRPVSGLFPPPMSSFDPTAVRKAVAEFTPSRPQKFQDLLPAKDVIAELRQKRASYRAIAELLTKHCLPTSKTAIAVFCHEVLGEIVRSRRRPARKRTPAPVSSNDERVPTAPQPSDTHRLPELIANPDSDGAPQKRQPGPRIAQVRIVKPPST